MRPRLPLVVLAGCLFLGVVAGGAGASQLIDRNPVGLTLQLNGKGEALLTYEAHGRLKHVLAWGALNALPPSEHTRQVLMNLDYTGGYGKYFKQNSKAQALGVKFRHGSAGQAEVTELKQLQQSADRYWQTGFHGGCGRYTGPKLDWAKITCTAPDGSYWAIQEWQRELFDYGVNPTATQAVWELRLSHWTGALPVLSVHTDWSFGGQWDHLYGTFTYLGQPVFGYHATTGGNPLDSFGRNVYIDTFDSIYGAGWRRENSALTHAHTGAFCYSFNPHIGGHPAGTGSRYRVTVIGPGLTPDVSWEGSAPGAYEPAADHRANDQIDALGDASCKGN